MKSYSKIVDPDLTYQDLFNLSTRLNIPAGRKYRVATHDQDLVMTPVGGKQPLTQDELQNTRDCCDPADCDIQP